MKKKNKVSATCFPRAHVGTEKESLPVMSNSYMEKLCPETGQFFGRAIKKKKRVIKSVLKQQQQKKKISATFVPRAHLGIEKESLPVSANPAIDPFGAFLHHTSCSGIWRCLSFSGRCFL